MVVLLANIGTILAILLDSNFRLKSVLQIENFIALGASLFVTVVPVLISISNNKWKNHFRHGLRILLLVTLVLFVWQSSTCTGKFCDIFFTLIAWALALLAIIFVLFYKMSIYAKKWNTKFVLSLVGVELILIAGGVLWELNLI